MNNKLLHLLAFVVLMSVVFAAYSTPAIAQNQAVKYFDTSTKPPVEQGQFTPNSSILFQDDFNDGDDVGWTRERPNDWTVQNGEYIVNISDANTYSYSWVGADSWTDYAVEFSVKNTHCIDDGVVIRGGAYIVNLRHGTSYGAPNIRLWGPGFQWGGTTALLTDKPFPLGQNTWLRIRVEAIGQSIKVFVDGNLAIDYVSPNLLEGKGKVALLGWSGACTPLTANFDDVMIYQLGNSDATPPAAVSDLSAASGPATGQVTLTWTAPGNDVNVGTATSYTVRYARSAITTGFGWLSATDAIGEPTPLVAGTSQSMTITGLTPGQIYFFAIKAQDGAGNVSGISNSPSAMALAGHIIDLTISIYKTVPQANRASYEAVLGYFVDGMYEMSNGVHKVRNVTIYQNGNYSDTANILWGASEWPRANVSGYYHSGQRVWMGDSFPFDASPYNALASGNHRSAGYALAHEWGHYYYGLYDEYKASNTKDDNKPTFPHSTDIPPINSVMNSQWNAASGDYNWLNFSVAENTQNGKGRTAQDRIYAASGWETISRPASQDPRDGERSATAVRIQYPELALVAPSAGQSASLELSTTPTQTTRSELHIVWNESGVATQSRSTSLGNNGYFSNIESALGSNVSYPNPVVLLASVAKNDFIANAGITASVIAPNSAVLGLSLKDDGIAPDALANDGFFSGIMPYSQGGAYSVTVTFDNNTGLAEYSQAGAAHSIGPNGETYSAPPQPVGENFTVSATTVVTITNFMVDDHGDNVATATVLTDNNIDLPGRIDRAGDIDVFMVTASHTGTLTLRISQLASGMQPKGRILAVDGITVIDAFDYQPVANQYFYALLDAKAGDVFYVEVSHSNANATTGFYEMSTGAPLVNEIRMLYLPLIVR